MKIIPVCGIFILDDKNRLLCVNELHDITQRPRWIIPGGGIDDGETPEQAAKREVKEETGFDVIGDAVPVYETRVYMPDETLHAYGFLYHAYSGVISPSDPEIFDVAFFELDEALRKISEIDNVCRIEPITHILGFLTAKKPIPFFRCDYWRDADGNVTNKKMLAA